MLITFHSGLLISVFAHLFTGGYCLVSLGEPCPPTYTHPLTVQGVYAYTHRFTLKCWWAVGGGWCWLDDVEKFLRRRKRLHFGDQVRAIACCLLILSMAQSGSCTRHRPRKFCAVFCRIDDKSRGLTIFTSFSTATKHKLLKDWHSD